MRAFRELISIPVGASVSKGVNLENERLVGLLVINKSDANQIRFQALISGSLDDPIGSQTWVDIRVPTSVAPPTAPYPMEFLAIALPAGSSANLLPRDFAGHVPSVIRIQNTVAGTPTNITGTDATFKFIVDPEPL